MCVCMHTYIRVILLFSHYIVFSSLRPCGLQHTCLPCPSLFPGICSNSCPLWASLGAQIVKNPPPMQKTWVWSWIGKIPWSREWRAVPVFLPGEFHGQRSLVGYSPWGRKEFHTTRQLTLSLSCPLRQWSPPTPGFPVHHQLPEFAQAHVIESVMLSNHLILCRPLFLPPSIFPSIRVFSSESALHIRWPKYWVSISPSNEYSWLISFRVDWFDLLSVQGTLKTTPQFKSINSLVLNILYSPTLTSIHDYWKNHRFNIY